MNNTDIIMAEISSSMVVMMGLSFILGSFFTILLLMFLDFYRQSNKDQS